MIPILRPTDIREWTEAAIKEYDFYRSLKYDEREATRLVALDVEEHFNRMHLSVKQYGEDSDCDCAAEYERGYNAGYQDAGAEEVVAEREQQPTAG